LLTSCLFGEFAFGVDCFEVERDVLGGGLEEFGDMGLGEPDGFVFEAALDAGAAVFRLVEEDAGFGLWLWGHRGLEVAVEGSVEEGFFEFVEGGDFAAVEGFQAVGFVSKRVKCLGDFQLQRQWR
jgi:hypothetical protein